MQVARRRSSLFVPDSLQCWSHACLPASELNSGHLPFWLWPLLRNWNCMICSLRVQAECSHLNVFPLKCVESCFIWGCGGLFVFSDSVVSWVLFFFLATAVRQGEAEEQLQDERGGWECWIKGVVLWKWLRCILPKRELDPQQRDTAHFPCAADELPHNGEVKRTVQLHGGKKMTRFLQKTEACWEENV